MTVDGELGQSSSDMPSLLNRTLQMPYRNWSPETLGIVLGIARKRRKRR